MKKPRLIRLNKFIADAGITSRRKADDLIEEGLVKVNGKVVARVGTRIDEDNDRVKVRGKLIPQVTEKVYFIFNKPKKVLSTLSDPEGRPTVADYFQPYKERIFPVGRLDWDSEGLLLMTNDGDFSNEVTHPKKEIPKTYLVKIDGHIKNTQIEKLKRGVSIMGGKARALSVETIKRGSDQYDWVKIIISEGRNRQIRRMFEKIGMDVKKLQRVAIGQLRIGSLKRGAHKPLNSNQLMKIFKPFKGMNEEEKLDRLQSGFQRKKKKTRNNRKKNIEKRISR